MEIAPLPLTGADREREERIAKYCAGVREAQTPEARRYYFTRMRDEISHRSLQQIAHMEHQRGLR